MYINGKVSTKTEMYRYLDDFSERNVDEMQSQLQISKSPLPGTIFSSFISGVHDRQHKVNGTRDRLSD